VPKTPFKWSKKANFDAMEAFLASHLGKNAHLGVKMKRQDSSISCPFLTHLPKKHNKI
jgi:hypothetical protein